MAKQVCIPCFSATVREAVLEALTDEKDIELVKRVPECPEGVELNLCLKDKSDKPRTAYQEFVSSCMKEKGVHSREEAQEGIKDCAREWRERKK